MSESSPNTASSANTDPQLLLESGPMLLRDFNPKGMLRFDGRKCVTCGQNIMNHWLKSGSQDYWCELGGRTSEGLEDARWDVPEGFGSTTK